MEILANSLAQIPRFADIDHSPKAVLHQVHTGLMGQLTQLVPYLLRRGHTPLCQTTAVNSSRVREPVRDRIKAGAAAQLMERGVTNPSRSTRYGSRKCNTM